MKLTQDQIDELRESGQLPEGFVEADAVVPVVAPWVKEAEELADQIVAATAVIKAQQTGFEWNEAAGGNLLSDLQRNFSPEQWREFYQTEHVWSAEGEYGNDAKEPVVIKEFVVKVSTLPPLPAELETEQEEVEHKEGPTAPVVEDPKPPVDRMEELWVQEDIDHARALAPDFEMNYGRFDPFSKDIIAPMLNARSYSALLQRPIHHLDDAIAHAMYLCKFWAKEDAQAAKDDAADPSPPTSTQEQRVEAARIAWKTAVAQRKDALAQWDAYVGQLRRRFQRLRDKR